MKRNIILNLLASGLLALPLIVLLMVFIPKYKGDIVTEEKATKAHVLMDISGDGVEERIQVENLNGKDQLYCEVWSTEAMVGIWQKVAFLLRRTLKAEDIDGDGNKELIFFTLEGDSLFGNAVKMSLENGNFSARFSHHIFITSSAGKDYDVSSFQALTDDLDEDGIPELIANINQGATVRGIYAVNFPRRKSLVFSPHFIHITDFYIDRDSKGKKRIVATSYANGNIPQEKVKLAAERYGADTGKSDRYLTDCKSYIMLLNPELELIAGPVGFGDYFSMQHAVTLGNGEKILSLQTGINDQDSLCVLRLFDEQLNLLSENSIAFPYDRSMMTKYNREILYKVGKGAAEKIIFVANNDSIMQVNTDSLTLQFAAYFPEVKFAAPISMFDLDRDGTEEILFFNDNSIYITRPDFSDGILLNADGKIAAHDNFEYTLPGDKYQGVRTLSNRHIYVIQYRFNKWWYLKWILIPLSYLGALFILMALQKIQGRKLEERNRHLEKVVAERTQEITLQKELIEEKQKEILDSINYAKRIQEAILPSRYSLVENLKNGFVFYKPKDIVAGDFYWLETFAEASVSAESGTGVKDADGKQWILFAAADCTGHGVPGAMVSVVCSNALSKSVMEEGILLPEKFLTEPVNLLLKNFRVVENR